MAAVSQCHSEIVSELLKHGADVNAREKYHVNLSTLPQLIRQGTNSLMLASWKNHVSIISLLLDAGAEIDATNIEVTDSTFAY